VLFSSVYVMYGVQVGVQLCILLYTNIQLSSGLPAGKDDRKHELAINRQRNCFSQLGEDDLGGVVEHNASASSISLCTKCAANGFHALVACLGEQERENGFLYKIIVEGDSLSDKYIHPVYHAWEGPASQLLKSPPKFNYIVYGGRYRFEISVCHSSGDISGVDNAEGCGDSVRTGYISLQSDIFPRCIQDLTLPSHPIKKTSIATTPPLVNRMQATFQFSYQPCNNVQAYDTANVSLYESRSEAECGRVESSWSRLVSDGLVSVTGNLDGSTNITYTSPHVQGDRYYCLIVELNHVSCLLGSVESPPFCKLLSTPVWIRSEPLLAQILPFCRSHLSCGWVYIVITGSAILIVSLCLAIICVRCCDRKGRKKQSFIHDEIDFSGGEVINLTSTLPERRTWQEVHLEWEETGERSRGKILLLYSPDTKLFKELQEALKSFLEMACHCDIYDLFDDELFDTIALDPALWLEQFTKDSEVKVIIISSIGAYRRQMALQLKMPLNLPENSLLDGLFTSGLKFVSSHPELASSGRVATARYEMLHLTEEGHRLGPPVGGGANNEFLIPTQLHELFCWVHQLQPLDLMGKPWANYHLEHQLLQDALKLVRRDRTLLTTTTTNGNGITQL